MRKITKQDARKVLEVVDAGLVSGLGIAKPGKMCVEAAICYALELPHGDQPECVANCIRRYKIRINDASWSSNAARTAGMRRAAIAQLGSDFLDLPENRLLRKEFVTYLAEQVIRQILPVTLRAVALRFKDKVQAEKIVEAALRCENEGTREAAQNARKVCRAAAAYDAADAAAAAERAKKRDEILNIAAEICVQACIKFKTPGSKWLDLAPIQKAA